jgi:hypothetical protein
MAANVRKQASQGIAPISGSADPGVGGNHCRICGNPLPMIEKGNGVHPYCEEKQCRLA